MPSKGGCCWNSWKEPLRYDMGLILWPYHTANIALPAAFPLLSAQPFCNIEAPSVWVTLLHFVTHTHSPIMHTGQAAHVAGCLCLKHLLETRGSLGFRPWKTPKPSFGLISSDTNVPLQLWMSTGVDNWNCGCGQSGFKEGTVISFWWWLVCLIFIAE